MSSSLKLACFLAVSGLSSIPTLGICAANSEMTPGAEAAVMPEAQGPSNYAAPANVFVPESTRMMPGDAGRRAHTNYFVKNVHGVNARSLSDLAVAEPAANPTPDSTFAEYPASLSCLYKMGPTYAGCAPQNNSAYNANGGSRAIAVVLAFDNPTALADLQYFASFFGFAAPKFTKVIANGNGSCVTPPYDAGWALESSLDTQWSFAMAPKARIILVEACSNSYVDLMYAEQIAIQQVNLYGGGEVSNSWSSGEFSTESTDWDSVFRSNWSSGKPVKFIFSAGDSGVGAQYPSVSPWVISAGGTTINRDATTQAFTSESCWSGSGGGTSLYETWGTTFGSGTGPWTGFQYPQFGPSARRTPDVSFDADPASGAWVRSNGVWYVVGGTSLSAPALAGVMNSSNNQMGVAPRMGGYYSNMENNLLYAQLATNKEYKTNFYDVTTGSNGVSATAGWDSCTGVGSPRGKLGK
jgi:subtilase family serine protease